MASNQPAVQRPPLLSGAYGRDMAQLSNWMDYLYKQFETNGYTRGVASDVASGLIQQNDSAFQERLKGVAKADFSGVDPTSTVGITNGFNAVAAKINELIDLLQGTED